MFYLNNFHTKPGENLYEGIDMIIDNVQTFRNSEERHHKNNVV